MQRRKSVVSSTPPATTQRRKSVVAPTPPSIPNQRRKSIVAPSPTKKATHSPTTKKRPSSLLLQQQQQRESPSPPPTVTSKSTAAPRKSVMSSHSILKRPFQANSNSILKTRPPITAPSTPSHEMDLDDDEINEIRDEDNEFDMLCNDNTIANTTIIASPVSIEKDEEETASEDTAEDDLISPPEDEEDEDEPLEEHQQSSLPSPPPQQRQQQQPVYGSLASTKPISKSEQVRLI